MISNKAFFSRKSAPLLTSFLEKSFFRYHYRSAHFFFRQPIFRQPFLGLGSAGICFFWERTHFSVVESASNIGAHFFFDNQFSTTSLVAKVQGLGSAGICSLERIHFSVVESAPN